MMTAKPNVLFLCTGNSCRSQMAEGWAKRLKGRQANFYSAGVETHGLNALAVKVMAEAGVDISGHQSQHVDEFKALQFDRVYAVCDNARQCCPAELNSREVIPALFADPPALAKTANSEAEVLQVYRNVRDDIKRFIEEVDFG